MRGKLTYTYSAFSVYLCVLIVVRQYDYTKGQLHTLIDILIEERVALFVCAIGVPPREVVDKLHAAGIFFMNVCLTVFTIHVVESAHSRQIVGHPKHITKALSAGADIICAQGGEAGGHTGEVPSSVLIPACVDAVKSHRSPLTGEPVYIIGAGGVFDGRGLAANLAWGAQAVWVGTRFVATLEAAAPKAHKDALLKCGFEDATRTLIYSGRPLRGYRSPYVHDW
jgi:NAD(P)H-dependent flavin oxidoreductase YrpB (nitropropane dioxygenase family)